MFENVMKTLKVNKISYITCETLVSSLHSFSESIKILPFHNIENKQKEIHLSCPNNLSY